ncbi:hypothetical protein EVAR_13635_1 [Eumeta japonica]|uniref:Uncharacterized protein n=1 Tax=Eumeta variegata TaxID=151549 RepID=A0A4C1UUP6_EUMVA|nr:hypothetical protein EVAR_13635_1 [Eumeta japonica]
MVSWYSAGSILSSMIVVFVLFFMLCVAAQEHGNPLSTVAPSAQQNIPFMDLFTGASNYFSEPQRKTYVDPGYYSPYCPRTDILGSFASILASAAKIMLATVAIVFLKVVGAKLLLLPVTVMLVTKIGMKALILWPLISRMIKYFRRKGKKGHKHKGRTVTNCSERVSCVLRKAINGGWTSEIGAAAAFSLIDVEEDPSYSATLLNILAGDEVARCMQVECVSGVDIN